MIIPLLYLEIQEGKIIVNRDWNDRGYMFSQVLLDINIISSLPLLPTSSLKDLYQTVNPNSGKRN